MYINILPLVGLLSLTLAAPQDTSALTSKFSPPLGTTGAIVADASGNTRIFTQASNGSIILISGSGTNTGNNYHANAVFDVGVAKFGTPIAAAALGNPLSQVSLVKYLGSDNVASSLLKQSQI